MALGHDKTEKFRIGKATSILSVERSTIDREENTDASQVPCQDGCLAETHESARACTPLRGDVK